MEAEFNEIDRKSSWAVVYQQIRNQSSNYDYTYQDAKKTENKNLNRYRDVNPFKSCIHRNMKVADISRICLLIQQLEKQVRKKDPIWYGGRNNCPLEERIVQLMGHDYVYGINNVSELGIWITQNEEMQMGSIQISQDESILDEYTGEQHRECSEASMQYLSKYVKNVCTSSITAGEALVSLLEEEMASH